MLMVKYKINCKRGHSFCFWKKISHLCDWLCMLQVEHVKAERNLLAEVASNYIVKLYCSFQNAEYLYLVMEYLPGGDLMTLLMREETLTETVARFYIAQTVLAIESIHKYNYIHRSAISVLSLRWQIIELDILNLEVSCLCA